MLVHSIAAIIPLYNGAAFVERALRSVLSQSLAPDEIILVDDGSSDDGLKRAESVLAGRNNAVLSRQANGGQSSARNHGARLAKSSMLAFLDQDDWWYPDHLALLAKPFQKRSAPPLGWSYSDLDEYDAMGRLQNRGMLSQLQAADHPKRSLGALLRQDMYVLPSASLIRADAFREVRGFDEQLSGYEDDDLFLRLFAAGYGNAFVPKPLSAWRIHSGSSSHSMRMYQSAMLYAEKLIEQFPNEPIRSRYYVRDLIAPRFLRSALGYYRRAAESRRPEDLRRAISYIDRLTPMIRPRRQLPVRLLRPLLSSGVGARWAFLAMRALAGAHAPAQPAPSKRRDGIQHARDSLMPTRTDGF